MLTETFEFLYPTKDGVKWLMTELEYTVGMRDRDDTVIQIGEITDREGNTYELTTKQLREEFQRKYWNEVELERAEVRTEGMNARQYVNYLSVTR